MGAGRRQAGHGDSDRSQGQEQVPRSEAPYRRAQGSPIAREEGTAEGWALLQHRPVQGLAEQRERWRWQAVTGHLSCALPLKQ